METTSINGRQIVPKDTTLSIRRTDFFPYLYLRHDLFKLFGFKLIGNLIYRRSITRPYYESLNPYPKYVDQYLFDVGNPNLKPQFTTNYEFNIMADDFPIFSIGVNKTKDIFSNVTYQDDVTKIAYRTYDNIGSSKEFYLRFVGGLPPGGKYFFYAGTFMIYMQAIRFLTDHINDDVYYGAKYPGHNFVRAGNQVVLLQRLLEKREVLK